MLMERVVRPAQTAALLSGFVVVLRISLLNGVTATGEGEAARSHISLKRCAVSETRYQRVSHISLGTTL